VDVPDAVHNGLLQEHRPDGLVGQVAFVGHSIAVDLGRFIHQSVSKQSPTIS